MASTNGSSAHLDLDLVRKHQPLIPISPLNQTRTIGALLILFIPFFFSFPIFKPLTSRLHQWSSDFLPLDSLVPPSPPSREEKAAACKFKPPAWKHLLMILLEAGQVAVWMAIVGNEIAFAMANDASMEDILLPLGMVIAWMFILVKTILYPPSTPSWSLFSVFSLLSCISIATLISAFHTRASRGHFPSWTSGIHLGLEVGNIVVTTTLIGLICTLPLASPETLARMSTAGIDDRVTLWSWLTFNWLNPFIADSNLKEMEVEDLPRLSPTQQTAIVFQKFRELASSSLLWNIILSNKFDLAIDGVLTLVSVICNYLSPYFLKRILDGITASSSDAIATAYVFAFLAFVVSIFKAVVDLIHLWHSRRATVRIKAELTAAIYDKALRRKDVSGVIVKKDEEDAQTSVDKAKISGELTVASTADKKDKDAKKLKKELDKKSKKEKAAKAKRKEESMVSADTGKVVNIMSSDTNTIGMIASVLYFIYANPLELVVASVFLYNILGWSAFAGVVVLAVAVPANSWVSKRSVQMRKDLLKARDKRISVMNELIGAITFIKFFAWTRQWKARAAEARANELKHLIGTMINGLYFSFIWAMVPILVTLVSFFCFIVIQKRELTVSIAFTSISLFSMLRMPLNSIPTFVVMILQAHVSVKRIESFLAEDEVPDWVSSLKRSDEGPALETTRIAFEKASFRWNSGAKQKEASTSTTLAANVQESASESTGSTNVGSSEAEAAEVFSLSNLSVEFPIGKLTVVTGPTGAGKTAILVALLGEMDLIEGKSHLPKNVSQIDFKTGLRNSVAYAAQTPWLQQKSIKENILFGEPLDEDRYDAVVNACALAPDFDVLEDGDETEIGAKGISLSGGQKARVALARAVYSYTQHVLLDDPLAAVDSHTAKHLTDKCLNGPLLKGRTVIIVSHHVELLLPITDYLIRILDGRIDAQGTPDELRNAGELAGLVAMEEAAVLENEPVVMEATVNGQVELTEQGANENGMKKEKKKKGPARKLIKDEERAIGNVKMETYMLYIRSATWITWIATGIILLMAQASSLGERYWLKVWGEAYTTTLHSLFTVPFASITTPSEIQQVDLGTHMLYHNHNSSAGAAAMQGLTIQSFNGADVMSLPSADSSPGFYLAVYSGISLAMGLLGVLSNGVGNWSSYRACVTLHDQLLDTVLGSTIRFFNTTPVGRIINRFQKDIETIDSSLNSTLRIIVIYVASLFSAIALVAVIIPWFLLPAAVISYLYYYYSVLYLKTGRSLRRLEATLRSPIFSGFGELLDGIVSVRAFSAEKRFLANLCDQVDKSHSAFYYYWMMNRWLLLRFDALGAASVFLTTLLSLSGAVSAGSAGIAIVSAQGFVSACYWVSRFWGQLEMDFNSVERVQEYLHIPQEPPAIIPGRRPPAYWPSSHGTGDAFLSVRDVEIKYAPDLPTVFKGSFDVKSGEKIGLIGRTGSGKSTLATALLRFTDPASGSIWLDGIDITSIGVDDLRSRVTFIPQDAVLFSGTIRDNLDPFNEHSDEDLIDALARVHLHSHSGENTPAVGGKATSSRQPSLANLTSITATEEQQGQGQRGNQNLRANGIIGEGLTVPSSEASSILITSTPGTKVQITLTSEVSPGGSNFSQGQRQLIAMARALLRRSNLIIMDEATASVDFATDEAIQVAIRKEFKDSTLLTIAHRLTSVIDYDRLLVLSDGKIAEFDTPINLLRKDDSLFKTLCEKSGKYKELYRAAENKESQMIGSSSALDSGKTNVGREAESGRDESSGGNEDLDENAQIGQE